MKTEVKLRLQTIGVVIPWLHRHGFLVPGSHLAARCADLEAIKDELQTAAAGQDAAHRSFRGGAARREHASAELHQWMADIARVARSLPVKQFGAIAEHFRLPRSQSYLAQQASAQAFIKVLRTMEQIFLDRGFEENFIAQGEAMIAAIEAANREKNSGVFARICNTATLMIRSSEGLAIIREFDAILQHKLRSNPSLLAEWNSVRRVPRPWKKSPARPVVPPPAATPLAGSSRGSEQFVTTGDPAPVPPERVANAAGSPSDPTS